MCKKCNNLGKWAICDAKTGIMLFAIEIGGEFKDGNVLSNNKTRLLIEEVYVEKKELYCSKIK